MSKSLAASKQLMQTYLSELLTEDSVEVKKPAQVKEKQAQPIEQLLNQVSLPSVADSRNDEQAKTARTENKAKAEKLVVSKTQNETSLQASKVISNKAKPDTTTTATAKELITRKSTGGFTAAQQKNYRQGDFQAMFFDVAGLTVAVPLIELGGIHNSDKTTALVGKPDWFKGVMLHRDEKVNVVDTARWVMPEKCNEELLSALDYQYVIMLNDSAWGLSAERLVDTVTLKQEDVKWLDSPSKRPWLAGLVKDRMCALIDVDSLIKLLEKGMNITQE